MRIKFLISLILVMAAMVIGLILLGYGLHNGEDKIRLSGLLIVILAFWIAALIKPPSQHKNKIGINSQKNLSFERRHTS